MAEGEGEQKQEGTSQSCNSGWKTIVKVRILCPSDLQVFEGWAKRFVFLSVFLDKEE